MTPPVAADLTPCPHCGAASRLEPSPAVRWRCAVCGGPVVPTDASIKRSHGELANLVRAQRTRAMALGWTAAGVVLGAIATMGFGLVLLVGLSSSPAAIALGLITLGAAVMAMIGLRRARTRRAESRTELDQAWELVASEVLRARPETTAADLARAMYTDETQAESLLARLSAEGRARVDVRDDAELAYRDSLADGVGSADENESRMRTP